MSTKPCLLVLIALALLGCHRRPVRDPDLSTQQPRVIVLEGGHQAYEVRDAIIAVMQQRRWMTEEETQSQVVARLMKTGVTVRLAIEFSADRVVIIGRSALGSGRNYEKWVSDLEAGIRVALGQSGQTSSNTTEATPADSEGPAVSAPIPEVVDPVTGLADAWANRSSFYVGMRGGLAFPPGAVGLAPSGALEIGVAPPRGFGFGVRALFMSQPPGVPFLDLKPAAYGFGALADFRYYFDPIEPMVIYPTIAVGFLAGPERMSLKNSALPLFNPGVGVKVKFGNIYGSFEFGLAGFTIPFVAVSVGYDGDSKQTKARLAAERSGQGLAAASP